MPTASVLNNKKVDKKHKKNYDDMMVHAVQYPTKT